MWRRLAALPVAALVALASGCSLVAVRGPPHGPIPDDVPLECTESRTAPVFDTAGAILTPLLGLSMWAMCEYTNSMQSWASDPQRQNCAALGWGTAIGTGLYAGSAVYGFRETNACRRVAAERWQRRQWQEGQPGQARPVR